MRSLPQSGVLLSLDSGGEQLCVDSRTVWLFTFQDKLQGSSDVNSPAGLFGCDVTVEMGAELCDVGKEKVVAVVAEEIGRAEAKVRPDNLGEVQTLSPGGIRQPHP